MTTGCRDMEVTGDLDKNRFSEVALREKMGMKLATTNINKSCKKFWSLEKEGNEAVVEGRGGLKR